MREAVFSVDAAFLADRGFQMGVFEEAGVREVAVISCGANRGVLRVHLAEPVDPDRLNEMAAIEWWESIGPTDEPVYMIEAVTDTPKTATEGPSPDVRKFTSTGATSRSGGSVRTNGSTRLYVSLAKRPTSPWNRWGVTHQDPTPSMR